MKILEHHVKAAVKRELKKMGAYQFWPVQTGLGAKTLDCLACVRGFFVAIETKAPGKKPTPLQQSTINAITESWGKALVVDSVDMAKMLPEIIDVRLGHTIAPEQSPDPA